MPTPFMHLHFAEQMQQHPGADGRLRALLAAEWPAFYLGSVAADLSTISAIARETTHFYTLPPSPEEQAYPTMFATFPELAEATALPRGRAVFTAAYAAHLLADLVWFREILEPFFVRSAGWVDRRQRFMAHNSLLVYLDRLAYESLPPTAAETLAAAEPHNWLPFAPDSEVVRWRDALSAQLAAGGRVETVAIFARRLEMTAEEFGGRVADAEWIGANVFSKAPIEEVQAILANVIEQSVWLLVNYLSGVEVQ